MNNLAFRVYDISLLNVFIGKVRIDKDDRSWLRNDCFRVAHLTDILYCCQASILNSYLYLELGLTYTKINSLGAQKGLIGSLNKGKSL